MLEERIERDIKAALLAGDTQRTSTLRGLKSALLYLKVATGKRDSGLSNDEILGVLSKEAKKRQESADLYIQGGDQARATAELSEKAIIEAYLPAQLSEEELAIVIDKAIAGLDVRDKSAMGRVIGTVKEQTKGSADGALIAKLTKEKLGL